MFVVVVQVGWLTFDWFIWCLRCADEFLFFLCSLMFTLYVYLLEMGPLAVYLTF